MTELSMIRVVRRSARAILIDDDGNVLLIKRTRPGRDPYWTTPGGGVEDDDGSILAAMHREIAEEMGAQAVATTQVFLHSTVSEVGVKVQHYFVARLTAVDDAARTGPEFSDPSRGLYETQRFDLMGDELAAIDLQPPALKDFVLANRQALLAEAAALG